MADNSGIERARRLDEALVKSAEKTCIPTTPLERFEHFFGHTVTLVKLAMGRGEVLTKAEVKEAKDCFIVGISAIQFSSEELARVQLIIDLAQGEWTPVLIGQLVEVNGIAFPMTAADRKRIKGEEEEKKLRKKVK